MKHFQAMLLVSAVMAVASLCRGQNQQSTLDPLAPVDASVDAALPISAADAVAVDPSGQAPVEMSKRYKALDTLTAEQRRKIAASSTGAAVLKQSASRSTLQPHAAQNNNLVREEQQSRSLDQIENRLSPDAAGAPVRGKAVKNATRQRPPLGAQSLSGLQGLKKLDADQDFTSVDSALPVQGLSLQTEFDPGSKLGLVSAKKLDFNPVSMKALRGTEKNQSEPRRETVSRRRPVSSEEPRETRRHKLNELSPGKRRLQELSDPDPTKRMKDEVLHPH